MSQSQQQSGFVPDIWFHTPVWSRKVVEHVRINNDLLKVLQKLEAETDPITRSNVAAGTATISFTIAKT